MKRLHLLSISLLLSTPLVTIAATINSPLVFDPTITEEPDGFNLVATLVTEVSPDPNYAIDSLFVDYLIDWGDGGLPSDYAAVDSAQLLETDVDHLFQFTGTYLISITRTTNYFESSTCIEGEACFQSQYEAEVQDTWNYTLDIQPTTQPSSVAEPTTLALMGLGIAGMAYTRRRKTQA